MCHCAEAYRHTEREGTACRKAASPEGTTTVDYSAPKIHDAATVYDHSGPHGSSSPRWPTSRLYRRSKHITAGRAQHAPQFCTEPVTRTSLSRPDQRGSRPEPIGQSFHKARRVPPPASGERAQHCVCGHTLGARETGFAGGNLCLQILETNSHGPQSSPHTITRGRITVNRRRLKLDSLATSTPRGPLSNNEHNPLRAQVRNNRQGLRMLQLLSIIRPSRLGLPKGLSTIHTRRNRHTSNRLIIRTSSTIRQRTLISRLLHNVNTHTGHPFLLSVTSRPQIRHRTTSPTFFSSTTRARLHITFRHTRRLHLIVYTASTSRHRQLRTTIRRMSNNQYHHLRIIKHRVVNLTPYNSHTSRRRQRVSLRILQTSILSLTRQRGRTIQRHNIRITRRLANTHHQPFHMYNSMRRMSTLPNNISRTIHRLKRM